MKTESFVLHTYRYEYLEQLKKTGLIGNRLRQSRQYRFIQPESDRLQGIPGPPGPPGSPGLTGQLSGIQAQLTGADGITIDTNVPVRFNSIVSNPGQDIDYSSTTGEFTIKKPGNYFVNWWVNTDGAVTAGFVMFSLLGVDIPFISSSSPFPLTTLQLNGTALVPVDEAMLPARIRLVNTTGDTVTYGTTTTQANIVIMAITYPARRP